MVQRSLTSDKIEREKKTFFEEGEDCTDKMLLHINKRWKSDPKIVKKRLNTSWSIELIAHNGV